MNTFTRLSLFHRLPALILAALLLLPASALANNAGVERIVQLADGSTMKVFLFDALDGSSGPWPLCVLMPGGAANEYVARAQFWLGHELAARGWAIAVPVSPDSRSFFGRNGELIPEVIEKLQESPKILPGKSLLVGVSNGGSSALQIAARNPELYHGVVAVPGVLREDTRLQPMDGLPIYIRIGENDMLRWNSRLPEIEKRLLEAGASVDADLVAGARHVFRLNWDELQPWLNALDTTPVVISPAP